MASPTMPSTTTSLSQPTLYTSSHIKSTPTLSTALTSLVNSAFYRSASSDPRWDTTIPRFDSADELCEMIGDERSVVAVIYSSRRETTLGGSEEGEGDGKEEGEMVACAAAIPWKGGWHREGATTEGGWEIKTVCVSETFVGRGLASQLVAFLGDHLCAQQKVEEKKVTLWLLVADDLNGAYWRRRGWTEVRRKTEGPGVWGCKGEFDMVVLKMECVA